MARVCTDHSLRLKLGRLGFIGSREFHHLICKLVTGDCGGKLPEMRGLFVVVVGIEAHNSCLLVRFGNC